MDYKCSILGPKEIKAEHAMSCQSSYNLRKIADRQMRILRAPSRPYLGFLWVTQKSEAKAP